MSSKLIVEELFGLYDQMPDLILYKNDLIATERTGYIEEIAGNNGSVNLNPLDVVLESLINVLSEKLSIDTLTQSQTTVVMDKSIHEQAVQRILSLVKEEASILEEMHKKWLENLGSFISILKENGVQTLQEVIFQVGLKFRISATSSLKALTSL